MVQRGKTSEILELLYGETDYCKQILQKYTQELARTYNNKNLGLLFSSLGGRIIAIAPMKLCEALVKDLGKKVKDEELAALGLHMLAISTHDDVVDEMKPDRTLTASLIYAGNIASNAGSKLLLRQQNRKAATLLLDTVNQNHFRQQIVIETLWKRPPASFKEYTEGIWHICVFTQIGLEYALALVNRQDLTKRIKQYAEGYGIALQLVDDLREVEEDKKFGYWSYPIVEGEPYRRSFKELFRHIEICKQSVPASWKNMRELVERLEKFALSIDG